VAIQVGDTVTIDHYPAHQPWLRFYLDSSGTVEEIRKNPKVDAYRVGELWWEGACLRRVEEEDE
jgi:hypothetical protein